MIDRMIQADGNQRCSLDQTIETLLAIRELINKKDDIHCIPYTERKPIRLIDKGYYKIG